MCSEMCGFLSILYLSGCVILVESYPNIVIFHNLNGAQSAVFSTILVTNGTNLTLTCKLTNISKQTQPKFGDQIVWSKKRRKLRFSNLHDLKMLIPKNVPDVELRFTPATFKNQGTYVCATKKHRMSQSVRVIVRLGFKTQGWNFKYFPSRRKRDLKPVKTLNNSQLQLSWSPWNSSTWQLWATYSPPAWKSSTFPTYKVSEDAKTNEDKIYGRHPDMLLKFIYIIGGGFAMFVIMYVIINCCRKNDDETSNHRNRTLVTNTNRAPQTNRPLHRHNVNNPTNHQNNDSSSLGGEDFAQNSVLHPQAPYMSNQPHTGLPLSTIVHNHNCNNPNLTTHSIDLPPTYDGIANQTPNADNDNSGLPPTYEEALLNIALRIPSHQKSSFK